MPAAWIFLFVAGLMGTGQAFGLRYTVGFAKLYPSPATVALMIGSYLLPGTSPEELPAGTAGAVWTGIGAVGTVAIGIFIPGESRDTLWLLCILLIVAGIAGFRVVRPEEPDFLLFYSGRFASVPAMHSQETSRGSASGNPEP